MKRGFQASSLRPDPGRPQTDIDYRLAAQDRRVVARPESHRLELFQDYLELLRRDEPASSNPEVQEASLALLILLA